MSRPLRRPARRRAAGYTMIEVMMSLAILAVGASGVMALQKVTVLGVTHGRNINTATTIASAHLEAMRADAQRWNSLTDYPDTTLLSVFLPAISLDAGGWTLPPNTPFPLGDRPGPGLGASDITGATRSSEDLDNPFAYCTHVRVTPMVYDRESPRWDPGSVDGGDGLMAQDALMLRLEVRTFWAKSGRPITTECQPGFEETMSTALSGTPVTVDGIAYDADDYGWIFLATAVRRNMIGAP